VAWHNMTALEAAVYSAARNRYDDEIEGWFIRSRTNGLQIAKLLRDYEENKEATIMTLRTHRGIRGLLFIHSYFVFVLFLFLF